MTGCLEDPVTGSWYDVILMKTSGVFWTTLPSTGSNWAYWGVVFIDAQADFSVPNVSEA